MPENSEKKKINWKRVLICVIIGVILGGLLAVWIHLSLGIQTSFPKVVPVTPKTATTSAKKDETADWKTYTSKTANFSIKYPKTWGFSTMGTSGGYLDQVSFGPKISMEVDRVDKIAGEVNTPEISIKKLIDFELKYSQSLIELDYSIFQVAGVKAYKLKTTAKRDTFSAAEGVSTSIYVAFQKNNLIYSFRNVVSVDGVNKDLPELDKMLSTFRFD